MWPDRGRDRGRRQIPAEVLAQAAALAGGSVAQIDGSQISDPDGYVPPEAIVGAWPVGPDGRPTGEFVANPRHGPIRDDFTRLESPDHWLGWLPGTPAAAVRASIESVVAGQVPAATVPWIKVVDTPVFLTGGVRDPSDGDRIVVRRAGLAVPFALGAIAPGRPVDVLTGVFTWVATGLDAPEGHADQVWFDLGMTRQQAETRLEGRIFELDRPD
jgi:hypothetical protein